MVGCGGGLRHGDVLRGLHGLLLCGLCRGRGGLPCRCRGGGRQERGIDRQKQAWIGRKRHRQKKAKLKSTLCWGVLMMVGGKAAAERVEVV